MGLVECPFKRFLLLGTQPHSTMWVERIESEVLKLFELTHLEQPCMHSRAHIYLSASANLEAAKIRMINGEVCAQITLTLAVRAFRVT
jgi:hypothetical protein